MPISPATAPSADFQPVPAETPARASSLMRTILQHRLATIAAIIILLIGLAVRLLPAFGVEDKLTVDEYLYITNVKMLEKVGPFDYPSLVATYVHSQEKMDMVMLPPTRFVYIFLGWAWDTIFRIGPRMSLRWVAAIFSTLSFLLTGFFAYRLAGMRMALAVGALMAVAPLELVMAHRELVDGVFGFWALLSLWLLWENMQNPGKLAWLAAYAASVAVLVLTKENAFFAAVGMGGIMAVAMAFPGLNLGKVKWTTWGAAVAGGLLGLAVLVNLAGDPRTLLVTYQLLVTKAEKMSFAYESGGGPWYRYIIDLMLLSPAVLLPAIGGIFNLRKENRQGIFLLLFVVFSCAVMVNVKNGMNVRYATIWDMPLRFFAAGMILQLTSYVRRAPVLAAVVVFAAVAAMEFHQYSLIFVRHDLGDPITEFMMRAVEIVRQAPS